jgi:predicted dehydrogenase
MELDTEAAKWGTLRARMHKATTQHLASHRRAQTEPTEPTSQPTTRPPRQPTTRQPTKQPTNQMQQGQKHSRQDIDLPLPPSKKSMTENNNSAVAPAVMNFGILSTANIARKNALAIQVSDSCRLVGVSSRSLEKAEGFISSLNLDGVRAYGSYQDLLDDPTIDAVYIPLPTTMHLEWVVKSAEKGKHVLVEKPVAVCHSDLVRMMKACADNNVLFLDGTMFVHHFRTLKLQSLLATPRYQQVHRMNSTFSFRGDDSFFAQNIRANADLDPLGALGDLGWYCTRVALLAFGTLPYSVSAVCRKWSVDGKVPLDLSATLYFDADRERVCEFSCSFVTAFCQSFRITTRSTLADKVITCDDFVIPRSGLSTVCKIDTLAPYPLASADGMVMAATEELRVGDCVQEVEMFRAFSKLAKFPRCPKSEARVAELQNGMSSTQRVIDAVLEAARGEKEVKIASL